MKAVNQCQFRLKSTLLLPGEDRVICFSSSLQWLFHVWFFFSNNLQTQTSRTPIPTLTQKQFQILREANLPKKPSRIKNVQSVAISLPGLANWCWQRAPGAEAERPGVRSRCLGQLTCCNQVGWLARARTNTQSDQHSHKGGHKPS